MAYRVGFPIVAGYQYFIVPDAENAADAIARALNGQVEDDTDYDGIEVDFDSNLAVVEDDDFNILFTNE